MFCRALSAMRRPRLGALPGDLNPTRMYLFPKSGPLPFQPALYRADPGRG
jgi:hypothetical protein